MHGQPWFCLGVALRRAGRMVGEYGGTERNRSAHGADHRGGISRGPSGCWYGGETNVLLSVVLVLLAASAAMIHFLARTACGELAVHHRLVLDFWESSEKSCDSEAFAHLAHVGLAFHDVGVGECAWRIPDGLRAAGNLLGLRRMGVAALGLHP